MGAVDMRSLEERMAHLGKNFDPPLEPDEEPCPCGDCDCPEDQRDECSLRFSD